MTAADDLRQVGEHVAGGGAGLGASEVSRKLLTDDDLRALIASEIAERNQHAAEYETMARMEGPATPGRGRDARTLLDSLATA